MTDDVVVRVFYRGPEKNAEGNNSSKLANLLHYLYIILTLVMKVNQVIQ